MKLLLLGLNYHEKVSLHYIDNEEIFSSTMNESKSVYLDPHFSELPHFTELLRYQTPFV